MKLLYQGTFEYGWSHKGVASWGGNWHRRACNEALEHIRRTVVPLNLSNGYHFVIDQYRSFLSSTLSLFDLLRTLATDQLSPETFATEFVNIKAGLELGDNDIRTLNYFYYFNFAEYLRHHATDLVFGTAGYNESANTRWLFEKNLQGPPYMECIIEAPFSKNASWRMHEALRPIFENEAFQIAPRIELWLDPQTLTAPSSRAGTLLLGTWSSPLTRQLRDTEPYRSSLSPAGRRNFHCEPLPVSDLRFATLADRIRSLLSKVFDRHKLAEKTT